MHIILIISIGHCLILSSGVSNIAEASKITPEDDLSEIAPSGTTIYDSSKGRNVVMANIPYYIKATPCKR
jgi:hypothetical protein